MMFVELTGRNYHNGCYLPCKIMFNTNDIARVVECVDDWKMTNIITKDGKIHTITDEYSNVIKKVLAAEE